MTSITPKVLIIDGRPSSKQYPFFNFTNVEETCLPDWSSHVDDLNNIIINEYADLKMELIFCQIVENYTDGSDSYLYDHVNHANLNKALIWAMEQGIRNIYMSFSFATPYSNMLCHNTNQLVKKLNMYCAAEYCVKEYKLYKDGNYCPSKEHAIHVCRTKHSWPHTLGYGDDHTSRLTLRALLDNLK